MIAGMTDFFHYNLWANRQLLDACSRLSDAQLDFSIQGVYGSVRQTLLHLFTSEEGYVQRFDFAGSAPQPPLKALTTFPGFDELRRRAERSGKALITIVEQADLNEVLHLDGGTYDAKLIIVMIQAVHHGIDHRSQIATLLSQQGIALPALDAWAYNDSLS